MVGLVCAGAMATSANAATARREPFGTPPDGTQVDSVVLKGANGVSARIMTLGATLQAFSGPDRSGHVTDVTLGYDEMSLMRKSRPNGRVSFAIGVHRCWPSAPMQRPRGWRRTVGEVVRTLVHQSGE